MPYSDPHSRRQFLSQAVGAGITLGGLSSLSKLAYGRRTERMPSVFIGHGDPRHVLADNHFTRDWQRIANGLPEVQAILVISAHWESQQPTLMGGANPKTVHDFYGFPEAMYQLQYPAPGAPKLADTLSAASSDPELYVSDEQGFDHGAWCVLAKMFPKAHIPVLQLSLGRSLSLEAHFALGQQLAVLRQRGVLLLGSGNLVHNLVALRDDYRAGRGDVLHDWAQSFDQRVSQHIERREFRTLTQWQKLGSEAAQAHPTLEHYLPLLYILGSAQPDETVQFFAEGFDGSISMRSLMFGATSKAA